MEGSQAIGTCDGKCGFPKSEYSEEYAASPGLQFYFPFRDGALLYKMNLAAKSSRPSCCWDGLLATAPAFFYTATATATATVMPNTQHCTRTGALRYERNPIIPRPS
ncbi:hypothetical protein NC651_020614 [Populus alba x Populus x berolinensis]|nr:hypothetical protein NC651_020614 [Populus alba x Populus x berolinensis]